MRRRAAGGIEPHALLVVNVSAPTPIDPAVLRRVAAAVRTNARSTDLVARVGDVRRAGPGA